MLKEFLCFVFSSGNRLFVMLRFYCQVDFFEKIEAVCSIDDIHRMKKHGIAVEAIMDDPSATIQYASK